MDIKNMSIEQLKALAYDEVLRLEQSKNNLQILNKRINDLEIEKQKVPEVKDGGA